MYFDHLFRRTQPRTIKKIIVCLIRNRFENRMSLVRYDD